MKAPGRVPCVSGGPLDSLALGQADAARYVVARLADSIRPAEAQVPSPSWLRSSQAVGFRRAVHAISRFRGCLLADAVGTGKTYIALAVATAWNGRRPTCCILPPPLVSQWSRVAARLGVHIAPFPHSRLSHGRVPADDNGLVIIDESHHFRNPGTKRYRTLAPWISGRPVLLLSATPVVNAVVDLYHQISLAVRDGVLAPYGISSLDAALRQGQLNEALGHLVIVSPHDQSDQPSAAITRWRDPSPTGAVVKSLLQAIERLALSSDPTVATLLRGVFWRAWASSPAALASVIDRYRHLLYHARDAAAAGRPLSRGELRGLTGPLPDQLVMWPLFPPSVGVTGLPVGDLATVERIAQALQELGVDNKVGELRRLLADGKPSLVFAAFRATVRYLRRTLGPSVAWCAGEAAGVGSLPMPREDVLQLFSPESLSQHSSSVRVLISTDVAAEGLDLHRAARIVHYDLPWNDVRLQQRNGRVVRRGSLHDAIDIVRLDPPKYLESRLRLIATLHRKRELTERLGFTATGRERWRWRGEVASALGSGHRAALGSIAAVPHHTEGILAGLTIRGEGTACLSSDTKMTSRTLVLLTSVIWIDAEGRWTEAPDIVSTKLLQAHATRNDTAPPHGVRCEALAVVRGVADHLLERLQCARWQSQAPDAGARALIRRLERLADRATRERDQRRLRVLDNALSFLRGGHTAGERAVIRHMAGRPSVRLENLEFPRADSDVRPTSVELSGMIIFRSQM